MLLNYTDGEADNWLQSTNAYRKATMRWNYLANNNTKQIQDCRKLSCQFTNYP